MSTYPVPALGCNCERCKHGWYAIKRKPERCPKCKSRTWNDETPKKPGRPRKLRIAQDLP